MATIATPAALEGLHAAAGSGREQLHELVGTVRQLFAQLGYGEADAVCRQAALQQQYSTVMAMLRSTLVQCCSLAAKVESQGLQASTSETPTSAEAISARSAQLQAEISLKNEVLKQLIDQLRQMLESMCLWESHKHQLERLKQAEGH